jgi:predicted RNA-binding Zn-ribbon protein involved in translation (DUF1610 family)
MKSKKLLCLKCKKPMRLISTGSLVRTFRCPECGERKIVKREEVKNETDT